MPSGRLAAALAAGVILLGVVSPLAAQTPVRQRQPARGLDTVPPLIILAGDRRARLGVTVNMQRSPSDELGALIESVTPNGPADKAGIRSGDIIVRFGSTLLTEAPARTPSAVQGSRSSLPGLSLIELASRLEPYDTVLVEVSREGKRHTVSLVPAPWFQGLRTWRTPEGGWVYQTDSIRMEFDVEQHERFRSQILDRPLQSLWFGGSTEDVRVTPFYFPAPLMDLELAPLNPDLGAYFGVPEGVLVISVSPAGSLRLRGGDVVLAVDGRRAEGPAHLHRILRSYQPDEAITLTIMRNHRRQSIVGTVLPVDATPPR